MEAVNKAFNTDPGQYVLLRDANQVVRIHLLQYLWKETLGYLLHPDVPRDIKRVADAGTGLGLWLCDVQRANPNIETLNGFDISADSFIKSQNLPASISLSVLDLNGPVPDAHKGKYDLVHLRLVRPAIHNGDATSAISHVVDLLRPGGYLQWEEHNYTTLDTQVNKDLARPSNLETLAELLTTLKPDWVEPLPKNLEARGLEIVTVEKKTVAPCHRLLMSYAICQVVTEISHAKVDVNGSAGLGDKLRAQTAAAVQEALDGSYVGFVFQTTVARKPL